MQDLPRPRIIAAPAWAITCDFIVPLIKLTAAVAAAVRPLGRADLRPLTACFRSLKLLVPTCNIHAAYSFRPLPGRPAKITPSDGLFLTTALSYLSSRFDGPASTPRLAASRRPTQPRRFGLAGTLAARWATPLDRAAASLRSASPVSPSGCHPAAAYACSCSLTRRITSAMGRSRRIQAPPSHTHDVPSLFSRTASIAPTRTATRLPCSLTPSMNTSDSFSA